MRLIFRFFCTYRFVRGLLHNFKALRFWLRNKKSTTAFNNRGSRRLPSMLIQGESPILRIINRGSRLNYFRKLSMPTMRKVVDSPYRRHGE
jgi:hypothetical protein